MSQMAEPWKYGALVHAIEHAEIKRRLGEWDGVVITLDCARGIVEQHRKLVEADG